MRKLIILILPLVLTSCFWEKKEAPKTDTPTTQGTTSTPSVAKDCTPVAPLDAEALKFWEAGGPATVSPDTAGSGKIVYVNYTLRTCTADGKILDTSREADAKSAGIYNSGRTYEPFSTIIGSHQTVRGFEYGLIGMKKGERRTIAVAPVDGYGEDTPETQTVPKYMIAPEYSVTLDKSLFSDRITQVMSKTELGDMATGIKVGMTLTGGQNGDITATVKKIDGENVTLDIDNSKNPFHGKELKPGTSATIENGTIFTITGLEGTGITFQAENKTSPFYGKYVTGATAEIPSLGTITLKSIEADDLIIEIPPS